MSLLLHQQYLIVHSLENAACGSYHTTSHQPTPPIRVFVDMIPLKFPHRLTVGKEVGFLEGPKEGKLLGASDGILDGERLGLVVGVVLGNGEG